MTQLLEHWTTNLQFVGSNSTRTCVYEMFPSAICPRSDQQKCALVTVTGRHYEFEEKSL